MTCPADRVPDRNSSQIAVVQLTEQELLLSNNGGLFQVPIWLVRVETRKNSGV